MAPSPSAAAALDPAVHYPRHATRLFIPKGPEPPCVPCADAPSASMVEQGLNCSTWSDWAAWAVCEQNTEWRSTFACRLSCYKAQLAYDGIHCCDHNAPAPLPLPPSPPLSPSHLLTDGACEACPDLPAEELRQLDQSCDAMSNGTRWWLSRRYRRRLAPAPHTSLPPPNCAAAHASRGDTQLQPQRDVASAEVLPLLVLLGRRAVRQRHVLRRP